MGRQSARPYAPLSRAFHAIVAKSAREKKGRPITFADAWIAAAALQLNVPLATHNARDYAGIPNLVVLTAPVTV